MFVDPIVQDIRRVRQNHAKRFGYDAQRILADFQKSAAMSEKKNNNRKSFQKQKKNCTLIIDTQYLVRLILFLN